MVSKRTVSRPRRLGQQNGQRFDGHKAARWVETDSQLLTAVDVLPDNARDSARALTLVARSQASADVRVAGTTVDTAHRDGVTRNQMYSSLTGFP